MLVLLVVPLPLGMFLYQFWVSILCFSFILLQSYLAVCCANEWHPKETTSDALTALLFADAMYFQPELLPTTNRLDVQIKGGWIWEAFGLHSQTKWIWSTLLDSQWIPNSRWCETRFQGQRNGKGIDYLQFASRTHIAGTNELDEKRPILTGIAMCGGHLPVQNWHREPADTPGLELDQYFRCCESCKFTPFFPKCLWALAQ